MAQAEVDFERLYPNTTWSFNTQECYYNLFKRYSQQIHQLRITGSRLLQKIKVHEIKMNKRKQKNLKPHLKSIDLMAEMITKLVKISAFIETYRYFQVSMQLLQRSSFHKIAENYYNKMLKVIVLKIKRLDLVDFSIN